MGNREWMFSGYGVFFSGDQKVLKLEGSGGLTMSCMHSMPLNCTISGS